MNAQKKEQMRDFTRRAVRLGVIPKPKGCPSCGAKGVRLDAHHKDYADPLNVEWCCRECHIKSHRETGLNGFGRPRIDPEHPLTQRKIVRLSEADWAWIKENGAGRKHGAVIRDTFRKGAKGIDAAKRRKAGRG